MDMQARTAQKKRPNILLITCDQLQAFARLLRQPRRADPQHRCPGRVGGQVPHGMSNAPVCMAGRSVLLSGQHNRTCTGGIGNVHYMRGKPGSYPMPEYPAAGRLHFPDTTLPELLKAMATGPQLSESGISTHGRM